MIMACNKSSRLLDLTKSLATAKTQIENVKDLMQNNLLGLEKVGLDEWIN